MFITFKFLIWSHWDLVTRWNYKINQNLPVRWRLIEVPWVIREQRDHVPSHLYCIKSRPVYEHSHFEEAQFEWVRLPQMIPRSLMTRGISINLHVTGKFWLDLQLTLRHLWFFFNILYTPCNHNQQEIKNN